MMKRFLGFILYFMMVVIVSAQDMPPLPPLPDQNQPANSNNSTTPSSGNQAATNTAPGLPPLPGTPANSTDTAVVATPTSTEQNPSALTPVPSTDSGATTVKANSTKKHMHKVQPWQISKYRPNVIFGGWVKAKGGNESARLSWTAQEVLNALLFKKYKLMSPDEGKAEEGSYDGQEGRQWRQINFKTPKSNLNVQVFLRQSGKKIWLRVGPGEAVPTSVVNLAQARKIRKADLTALHLIQKKLGRRLSPYRTVSKWEAPYRYSVESADQ